MASQPESQQEAGSEANRIEVRELSEELKGLIDARQQWLVSTHDFVRRGDVYLNIDNTFLQEFQGLFDKLKYPPSAFIRLFRTRDNDRPTRIHDGDRKSIHYLYPLRIPDGFTRVYSGYPGAPGSIHKVIRIGTSVVFQDQVFIDGVLDFLLIGVQQEDSGYTEHIGEGEMAKEREEKPK
ncbi:hypothetical protein McanMca71_001840 [Microsporum canis]|uniref:Uncharacterized protein n=1 Tax=Arthroderma otae (strain ATCC MYA-4605 / CBS 113480) TaxID=554155 RepID=C5FXB4_ARTOC|nr:uncharacterized protein MCYG_07773 [Microsporum canis CBS 113480]EEQ34954.1 predicted protein [Microsporum canis CBS 113480]